MIRTLSVLSVVLAGAFLPADAAAQAADSTRRVERARRELGAPDSTRVRILRLRDGSSLTGRVIEIDSAAVRFASAVGTVTIPLAEVVDVREVAGRDPHTGEYWFASPNPTRLLLAPTGRMLKQGDGYFSVHEVIFPGFAYGLTDRVSIGGGMSVLPSEDFLRDNAVYVTPKVGLIARKNVNVAVGAVALTWPDFDTDSRDVFGILYAVGTLGGPNASVTGGIGYGYAGSDLADRPALMLGADLRFSRYVSFVTENYRFPTSRDVDNDPLISYALRLMVEKAAIDVGFINVLGQEIFFPGTPYIGFVYNF
jgi:hypothetical protein